MLLVVCYGLVLFVVCWLLCVVRCASLFVCCALFLLGVVNFGRLSRLFVVWYCFGVLRCCCGGLWCAVCCALFVVRCMSLVVVGCLFFAVCSSLRVVRSSVFADVC